MAKAKRKSLSLTSAIALLWASAVLAGDPVGSSVEADLDGDGAPERFQLLDTGEGTVDLEIDRGGEIVLGRGIAWIGGIGQQPELSLAPNGSVLLTSMNEAIGRDRWHLTLTIAHRGGAYTVAGYTFAWYDTLDPQNNGTCDLNLLTGRGFVSWNGGDENQVRTNLTPRPVTEWRDDVAPPEVCFRD